MWIVFALVSAFFAGVTSILAKCGIKHTDSKIATAIRTGVVLIMAFITALIAGSVGNITSIDGKSLLFLVLSGLATGASWLCYFKALSIGDVNKVVPIDKSSTVLTVLFSFAFLGEPFSWWKGAGMVLMTVGTFLMIERKGKKKVEPIATETPLATGEKPLSAEEKASLREEENLATGEETVAEGERKREKKKLGYIAYAVFSAVFAALTSILGKVGIDGVESNLGTFIRTGVVLVMSWIVVFAAGKGKEVKSVPKKELWFIILSGIATGVSWICYYKALKDGVTSAVVSIDKASVLITVAFSYFALKERLSLKALAGLVLLVAGTFCMLF